MRQVRHSIPLFVMFMNEKGKHRMPAYIVEWSVSGLPDHCPHDSSGVRKVVTYADWVAQSIVAEEIKMELPVDLRWKWVRCEAKPDKSYKAEPYEEALRLPEEQKSALRAKMQLVKDSDQPLQRRFW